MLINQGVPVPEKGTQTQSLCLEGSKAGESYMSLPFQVRMGNQQLFM